MAELATKNRLPTISDGFRFAEAGGLIYYGPDYLPLVRRAAVYVDKILKGTKPADIPVEQPTGDEMGLYRRGNALFGETLVAVDIETGRRKWHYQIEHHGLWDRDIPCAPILCDIPHDGRIVKALAHPTKQAFLYVLDRVTGKPIWPIIERKVEKGDVPGEWYSPTQPVPPISLPPSLLADDIP